MVQTRSNGNDRDKTPHSNPTLPAKKLIKHHRNLSSTSKGSKSTNTSFILDSDANTTSPLRRSKRDTTKRMAQTPQKSAPSPTPSPSTKKKNLTPSSNQSPNPTAKKTSTVDKMKTVSGSSTSSIISPKKKSKGKEKPQVEAETTQSFKRNLDFNSNSSSPLGNKEEGSRSTKRQRVLLHAKAYRDLFRPHSKTCKPSPPVKEQVKAIEVPVDVATMQADTDATVDIPVQYASCLREYSSRSKSANEATPSASEAHPTKMVSENNAEEQVISVAETKAESTSDERECEIFPALQCEMDDPPAAGSSREANTAKKVSENNAKDEVTSVAEAGAEFTSDEMECDILPGPQCKVDDSPAAGSTREDKVNSGEAVIAGDDALHISEDRQASDKECGPNVCFACEKPGVLLCCEGKGCKRSYHLSCLDPPLQSNPPGAWLCVTCIQKKIQFGVYAISDGIESIWDVKDSSMENQKLYLVKYKNLAHVHNTWVPEAEIAGEAQELLSKFNWKMHKDKNPIRWKQEWTEPQRLLMKRPLMSRRVVDEFFDGLGAGKPFCNVEWLVKWRGLNYEDATWELESSSFLCSEDGTSLIKAFEFRRQQARLSSYPDRITRALEVKQSAQNRLDKLPDGFPPGMDSEHLHSVNQIRLFWHKSQNAIFIDEQERVIKTILFILSVIEDICRPILIVSSANSLPLWESKFQRLAPSVNAVSYTGTKPVRKLIQDVEFYEESGCIMFQVLLSHPDAIVEDFEMLDSVGWEAVIVDDCQNSRMSKYLEKFKNLSADFRLLLLSSPLKDNVSEHMNMLLYLDPNHSIASTCLSKSATLAHLKEKLGHHMAYERKDEASRVSEYWVPARFSKVQLELYCSTLLSNSLALRSFSKIDHVGALRELLISTRKCCDHPYLVDPDLQGALTKDRPISDVLDIGVYASGKLLLLDKLLHEMKAHGLRVIIVFQSGGGSGRNQIGEILDDFIRQRFGAEAYEHVERGLLMSKKQTAMNNFNDKSKGRFVFLVENRACQPSLKLSAVDAVLIYNSDWNPMNDTRILQRINVQPERVAIFRFYSPCAVEEKILSLAKQDVFLDSNLQSVAPAISHSLLSWGAELLFSLLHQLHLQPDDSLENYCSAFVSPEDLVFVETTVNEILDTVHGKSSEKDGSFLVEAQPRGESYAQDSSPLAGEKKGATSLHGDPPVFWSALLERKNPQWRFIQSDGSLQRIRRKVRPFDNSENPSVAVPSGGGETEESRRRKKKKNGADAVGGMGMSPGGKTGMTMSARNPSHAVSTWDDITGISAAPSQEEISNQAAALASVEVGTNLRSLQRGIYLSLQPQLLNLCQSAGLPDCVKTMAGMLLEYVMNNFKVDDGGDATIVQTLVISLCWRAASLFKLWVDPLQLMALASEKLHYNCKADVVESIYCRLKVLKVQFQEKADSMVAAQIPSVRFYNKLFKVPKQEVITLPETPSSEEEIIESPASLPGQSKTANETDSERDNAKGKLLKAQLDLIEKVCGKREEALLTKQKNQVAELDHFKEREVMRLKKEQQSRLERFSGIGGDDEVRKLKEEFERKMSALEAHVEKERERLQALHAAVRELERGIKEGWVENSKSGNLEDDFDIVPLPDCGKFVVQEFSWDPPTPPLILDKNLIERDGDADMAPGLPNSTPSHTPQDTGVATMEVMPVLAATHGDPAAELTAQHRDAQHSTTHGDPAAELTAVESHRNTMMEQETSSVAKGIPPTNAAEPTLADAIESPPHAKAAETIPPAEATESVPHAVESTAAAEVIEFTPSVAKGTPPTNAAEPTLADVVESPPRAKAAEETPPAEATEPVQPAVRSTAPAEAIELTPTADATEPTPPIGAVESTTPAEAVELTPPADAPDLAPLAEAAESTMPALITSVTAATTGPAVVEVAVANGDITAISDGNTTADSVGVLPLDLSANVSRDAASHPLPHQSHGAVLPSQVPPQIPIPLVQDAGRQGAQVNARNVVCDGLGTANENGITVGVRSRSSYGPLWQMLPMASPMVFPHGLHADPLKNELTRIKQQEDQLARRYETKKLQLKLEMEEELERLRRRYDEMLQEEEDTYQRQKQHLEEVYSKVKLNQSLAEEFRAKFIEHRAPPPSSPAPSQLRNLVPGPRQMPTQSRVPQQIQRAHASPAVAPRPGSASANSNRPPSITALHISSTSSPLCPSATSQSPMRVPFNPVSLPPRPGPVLRTNNRAPAPHLARARPHISATTSISNPNPALDSVAVSATQQQLQSLLSRRLQGGPAALSQTQTQSLAVDSQSQERSAALNQHHTQNLSVESMLASLGNCSVTEQVAAVGDGVVCLSDDD